jgi:putative transcriptional regulator
LSVGTVRDWEQKRCQPDRPAQVLLRVIDREPQAALRALAA